MKRLKTFLIIFVGLIGFIVLVYFIYTWNYADTSSNNFINPKTIKIGDQVCGLYVKEIDSFKGIRFMGNVTISGICEYSDYTGDGDGYIFTVDNKDRKKLPRLTADKDSNKYFILSNFNFVDKIFKRNKCRATIIINDYYLIESQITTDAKLIKVIKI